MFCAKGDAAQRADMTGRRDPQPVAETGAGLEAQRNGLQRPYHLTESSGLLLAARWAPVPAKAGRLAATTTVADSNPSPNRYRLFI